MRRFFTILFACCALLTAMTSYASVFIISPKAGTHLPTSVATGGSVMAYYTVYNNTLSQSNENYVKYLPPNVIPVTINPTYSDTCMTTFPLAAAGQPGSSCTLQLQVVGPVNANDPDPHHHLFVCMEEGVSCTGPTEPLNVKQVDRQLTALAITPVNNNINVGNTQQYAASGTYSDSSTADLTNAVTWHSSSTAAATINASGLASGIAAGTTTITATLNGVTSNPATLAVANPLVSIAITPTSSLLIPGRTKQMVAIGSYADGSSVDISSSVTWHSSNTPVATISANGVATSVATGTTNITATMNSLTSNTAVLNVQYVAYVVDNYGQNAIRYCLIDSSDGSLYDCTATGGIFSNPSVIAIDPGFKYAYINDTHTISYCPINDDGTLGACTTTGNNFSSPVGIAINPAGTYAYITDLSASGKVLYCPINADGSLGNCTATGDNFDDFVRTLTINPDGTRVYVTEKDFSGKIYVCPIDANDGHLANCQVASTAFESPKTVALDASGAHAYITYQSGGTAYISYCTVNTDGTFSSCAITTNIAIITPNVIFPAIAVNSTIGYAYITRVISSTPPIPNSSFVYRCFINSNGSLNNCNANGVGDFQAPLGIAVPW